MDKITWYITYDESEGLLGNLYVNGVKAHYKFCISLLCDDEKHIADLPLLKYDKIQSYYKNLYTPREEKEKKADYFRKRNRSRY